LDKVKRLKARGKGAKTSSGREFVPPLKPTTAEKSQQVRERGKGDQNRTKGKRKRAPQTKRVAETKGNIESQPGLAVVVYREWNAKDVA